MGKKIYVGNLSYSTTEDSLRQRFETYGTVESARVVMDRASGRSKGFGFVEMSNDAEAQAAIAGVNGQQLDGRVVKANEALDKPRDDRGGRDRYRSSY